MCATDEFKYWVVRSGTITRTGDVSGTEHHAASDVVSIFGFLCRASLLGPFDFVYKIDINSARGLAGAAQPARSKEVRFGA